MCLNTSFSISFPQVKIFPQLKKSSTTRILFMIKEVFYSQRLFDDQGSFPQKYFNQKDFFKIRKVFHSQRSFPQKKIFPWSAKFSPGKDFSLIREFFARKYFSTNREVFHNQGLFLDRGSFPQSRKFSKAKDFFIRELFRENILNLYST